MRIVISFTLIAVLMSCNLQSKVTKSTEAPSTQFYVGTYTGTASASKGIYKYSLSRDGAMSSRGVSANSISPSFLAKSSDGRYLLAVNEIDVDGGGTIEAYQIKADSLILINKSVTGGAHPCFVAVNDGGDVLVANYSGGNVALLHQGENGRISELQDVEQHFGTGSTDRQEGPHAHSAWFDPNDGRVISVDLGTNELWFSSISDSDRKLIPAEPRKVKMKAGAGPRHLSFHPNKKWIYVIDELSSSVTILRRNQDAIYSVGESISTLPNNYDQPNTCADIHVSSDGRFVYASNRGHNSIAIYSIDKSDGSLAFISHESTRGDGPRNFAISPDEKYLVVANQLTDNIISFQRNAETGLLTYVDEISAPAPVCILF